MVTLPDGRILVIGGYSKNKVKKDVDKGIIHSDAFLLVSDSTFSYSFLYNLNLLFFFFFPVLLEHDTSGAKWKWQTVKLTGNRPSPRTGMTVTVNAIGRILFSNILQSFKEFVLPFLNNTCILGNRAFFFGGVHDEEEDEENLSGSFFNDLYCLDLEKLSFNRGNSTFQPNIFSLIKNSIATVVILGGSKLMKETTDTEATPSEAKTGDKEVILYRGTLTLVRHAS